MNKIGGLLLLIFVTLGANAQSKLNHFLTDLSINDFKLGSSFSDIKNNPKFTNDLSVLPFKNNIVCTIKTQKINFFGVDNVDEVILNFKNNILESVVIEIFNDSIDGKFEKSYNNLKLKYGEPTVKTSKSGSSKIYTWAGGESKLMLKPLKVSFIVKYYN